MLNGPALVLGNPSSAVRLIVYEDLQCGDCARLHRVISERLLAEYGTRVAVEYHDFPLAKHNWARQAAIAARYFERTRPGAGARFRTDVLSSLSQITPAAMDAWVRAFARRENLDEDAAARSLEDSALAAEVDADMQSGIERGVKRTPTAFLGPIAFIERFPYEDLALMIDAALKRVAA